MNFVEFLKNDFFFFIFYLSELILFFILQHSSQSMLGVHHSSLAIIHFGKIARKHNLTGVCLDSLNRLVAFYFSLKSVKYASITSLKGGR